MTNRTTEARFWQIVGVLAGVAGGGLLAYTFGAYGFASLHTRALLYGLMGSFLLMAGGTCFLAGRALHVRETRLTRLEAALWITLATVCLVGGAASIVVAYLQQGGLLVDRLTIGLAGAFALLFGVQCVVGERIMTHMHDALMVNRPEEKAQAAAAGGTSSN